LASGQLEAVDAVEVGTEISGQVQQLIVQLGDRVEKGQLLAILDPQSAENQVALARSKLRAAEADQRAAISSLKLAQQQQQRLAYLVQHKAAKQQALDEANHQLSLQQANYDKLAALLEQQHLEHQQKQRELAQTRIVAPKAGTVVAIKVQEGQTVVSAQSASTLFTIADLRRMTVRALISEADIIHLNTGLVAEFTLLGDPQKRFHGKITTIEAVPEKINEALFYPALFEVENPDGLLRLEMTAQVSVILESINDALVIPVTALGPQLQDGSYQVQVLRNGKPELRHVTVGISNELLVQVLTGLTAGELLIIPGHTHHAT
jgi:macrolide-specific efflux system membrane fusion protein